MIIYGIIGHWDLGTTMRAGNELALFHKKTKVDAYIFSFENKVDAYINSGLICVRTSIFYNTIQNTTCR